MGAFLAKLARRQRFTQSYTLVKVRLLVTVSQKQQGRAITAPLSLSFPQEFVTFYADPVRQTILNDMLLEF